MVMIKTLFVFDCCSRIQVWQKKLWYFVQQYAEDL